MKTAEGIVRHAQPSDEQAIFDLMMILHATGLGRYFPYSIAKVTNFIQDATRRRGNLCGVIDAPDRPGVLAGGIYLRFGPWYWSDASYLEQVFCIVRSPYRKRSGYAQKLQEWAEDVRRYFDERRPEGSPPVILERSYVEADPRRLWLLDRWFGRFGRRVGGVFVSGLP